MRVPEYVSEATLNAALIATYWALWFVAVGVSVPYPMLTPHWLYKVVHLCLFLLRPPAVGMCIG